MPEHDGWHDTAFLGNDGRMYRWHYCASSDRDTLVSDTPAARIGHTKECAASSARLRAEAERRRRAESVKRLRAVNRLRKETHAR